MEAYFAHQMPIPISLCDLEGKLGLADAFSLFMDLASVHAQQLGVGAQDMIARGLFWLTVKTKIHFLRRPELMEEVTVSTRPIAPDKVRSIREYRVEKNGELLLEGKTEWAVMEIATGRIHPMKDVFPAGLELAAEPCYAAPFVRLRPDFSDGRTLGSFRVRAVDVDIGGHMNNAAYPRAVLGLLSAGELKDFPQREIEIIFRAPCFEGEELTVLRRETEEGCELAVLRPDGTAALLLRAAR